MNVSLVEHVSADWILGWIKVTWRRGSGEEEETKSGKDKVEHWMFWCRAASSNLDTIHWNPFREEACVKWFYGFITVMLRTTTCHVFLLQKSHSFLLKFSYRKTWNVSENDGLFIALFSAMFLLLNWKIFLCVCVCMCVCGFVSEHKTAQLSKLHNSISSMELMQMKSVDSSAHSLYFKYTHPHRGRKGLLPIWESNYWKRPSVLVF